MNLSKTDILKLLASLIVCQVAGFIGSLFTAPAISTWYAALEKPAFNPPNAVFSPVWITLFFLMGIALFLIWKSGLDNSETKIAVRWFFIQLGLNVCWSIIFFGLKGPFLALIEIVFLWIAILSTIFAAQKVSKWAGILLYPYFLWVSFAAVLNFFLWNLNR